MLENVEVLYHSSIRISKEKIIYNEIQNTGISREKRAKRERNFK